MTGQQLKNSILQLAVQGKLVPQDPADEPASILLERIREEKEQLIREKKIKREKNPSQIFRGNDGHFYERIGKNEPVCIDEELPFEIPETWEWARLFNLFSIINGDRGKNYPAKSTLKPTGIPFISALNLNGKTVVQDENLLCMTEDQYNRLGNGKLIQDDVVVCIRGSLGKHGKYPFTKGAIASSLVILRSIISASSISDYIMMWLDAPIFFAEIKKYDNGTAQPNLAAKSLEHFLVPLPPLAEQQRIVAKIEELLPFVERYEQTENKLKKLNTTFPDQLKKSILQEAIQGKLVPQDPADEPASALLERIRAEKAQLIKDGKIKREKNPSQIFRGEDGHFYERIGKNEPVCIDEELPFEIPETWEWARLETLYNFIDYRGSTPTKISSGVPLITAKNVKKGFIDHSIKEYISEKEYSQRQSRGISRKGDILFTTEAPLGNAALADLSTFSAGQRLITFQQYGNSINLSNTLMVYFILSDCFQSQLSDQSTGTTVKGIKASKLKQLLIPLPPLAEQQRIVAKLEQLDVFIAQLTKS